MLVLERKLGQGIYIGGNVRVILVEIRGDRVKLAIDAPRAVSVHRDEVQRRVDAEGGRGRAPGA